MLQAATAVLKQENSYLPKLLPYVDYLVPRLDELAPHLPLAHPPPAESLRNPAVGPKLETQVAEVAVVAGWMAETQQSNQLPSRPAWWCCRRHLPYVLPYMDDLLPYIERFACFPEALWSGQSDAKRARLFKASTGLPGIKEC